MPDGGLLSFFDDLLLLSGGLLLLTSDVEGLFFEGHLLLLVDIDVRVLEHQLGDRLNTFWDFAKEAFGLHVFLRPSCVLFSFLSLLHLFFHFLSLCLKIDLSAVLLESDDQGRHLVDILGDTFNEPSKVLLVVGKTCVVDLLVELH